jgi:hypothetical protein
MTTGCAEFRQPDFLFSAPLEVNRGHYKQQQTSDSIAPRRNVKACETPFDILTIDEICFMYSCGGIVFHVECDSQFRFLRSCAELEDPVIIRIVKV